MNSNTLKKVVITTLASIVVSAGVYFFMVPYNLTIGGTAGLSIALSKFFPEISVGVFQLGINIILFILAFLLIGAEFGGLSIYATIVVSVSLIGFGKMFPNIKPLVDTPFMSMIVGVGVTAIGIALTLNQNASTGGTDIVGKILNEYIHVDISVGVFIADFSVVVMGYFAYGINAAMYAIVGILFNAVVIDKVLTGYKTRIKVYINSRKWEGINDYILNVIVRGSTLYEVKGGFNKSERVMIETILTRPEYIKLMTFIKEFDNNAFVNVATVSEVSGEGFSYLTEENKKVLKEKNKKVVSVISGGNIDVLMISSMINKGLIRRDRIFNFSLNIPDKPGELAKVVDLIAELGANVVKLEHNQFKNLSRFKDVELQVTVETNGSEHIKNLVQAFEEKGYEVIKIKSKII